MLLTQEQIKELEQLLDDPWPAIGASMSSGNPNFLLKAINDQMDHDGNDDNYDLNEKGEALLALYQTIYRANFPDEI